MHNIVEFRLQINAIPTNNKKYRKKNTVAALNHITTKICHQPLFSMGTHTAACGGWKFEPIGKNKRKMKINT